VRDVLERASARETAARVAGGAVAKAFLAALGVHVVSHVTRIGSVAVGTRERALTLGDFAEVDDDPVRCLDKAVSREMVQHINVQRKANESIGGVWEVHVFGLVPGLGSHVSWEEKLDGKLAAAVCSIQAHKAVEFGDGFTLAATPGSQSHDEIFYEDQQLTRHTNHSGGIEGGMSTGQPLVVRAGVKPIPTLTKPLQSVDLGTMSRRRRCGSARTPAWCPPRASWGRRWSRSSWPAPTGRSSAATTSTTCAARFARIETGSAGRPRREPPPLAGLRRLHGGRQVDPGQGGRAAVRSRGRPQTPTASSRPHGAGRSRRSGPSTARPRFGSARSSSSASCSTPPTAG
jgi:hypothetical protein